MTNEAQRQRAIELLGRGFTDRFVDYCIGHEALHELMMEMAGEFVAQEMPIVRGEDECDVAMELIQNVTIRSIV